MYLQRLKTSNFRLLKDFELEFSPDITVLIGPNNAGKSNVIDAVLLIKQGMTETVSSVLKRRQGFERVVSRHQIDNKVVLELSLSYSEHEIILCSVTLYHGGLFETKISSSNHDYRFRRTIHGMEYEYGGGKTSGGGQIDTPLVHERLQELKPVYEFFDAIVGVDPFRQAYVEYQISPKPLAEATGVDIAQVLHYHYNNNREGFERYEDIVRRVIPEVERIETPIVEGPRATVSLRFIGDAAKYNLWQISSGLKDVLILLAAIHFSESGALVLIEEPENHLHSASQKALSAVLREVAAQEQKQFILTTHSGVILEQFEPENLIFIDKEQSSARAIPVIEMDPHAIWERLGIERTTLLQILRRANQVIAIVEGRDDYKTLEPLWGHFELKDKVLPVTSGGGSWREIVDSASLLRDSLKRFNLPSAVFVLLDNDGERKEKLAYLHTRGFDQGVSHVWAEKEIESYLILPKALASISGKSEEEVHQVIAQLSGQGKARFEKVLQMLGIEDTPKPVIIKNTLAISPEELPEELKAVPTKIRRLLGLPPNCR